MATILAGIEKLLEANAEFSMSIVGSGGKTSLMRNLAQRLPWIVVCTTSTKLAADEADYFASHIIWESGRAAPPGFPKDVKNVLITGVPIVVEGHPKLSGLTEDQLIILRQSLTEKRFPLIIEADGSKRRPLKAPAAWEPVIPAFSDLVIIIVGMAGLMKPLNEENVFRSQNFAQLTGLEIGEMVDLKAILEYLKNPLGGMKGIPDRAKRFILFNLAWCDYPELVDRSLIHDELSMVSDGVFIEEIGLFS